MSPPESGDTASYILGADELFEKIILEKVPRSAH